MQASASPSDGQTVHPAGFPRAIRLPGVSAGGSFRYSISIAPVAGIIRGYPRRARAADESAPRAAREEGCGVRSQQTGLLLLTQTVHSTASLHAPRLG